MLGTAIRRIPLSIPTQENESFDIEDLAHEAADALEAYRRAPWLQLNQRTRLAKLHHAIELLERIEALETGMAQTDPGGLKERAQAGRA
jgi:hypothetical protein